VPLKCGKGFVEENFAQSREQLQPVLPTLPSAPDVRTQLERIIASRTFRSAEGQKKILRYAVERTIEGQDCIKEYSIATQVLGRPESFDPRQDSIVRVEARKLRARLAKYYEEEGEQDPVRIEFLKGSYVPVFSCWEVAPPISAALPPAAESAPLAEPVPDSLATPPAVTTKWNRPRNFAIAASLIVLLGAATYVGVARSKPNPIGPASSIVVLPFANLGDDKSDESFSDGLTEELIDSLARVPGLHVVARNSAFQYKGKPTDVRKIGEELSVRTVLEGSVRKDGNRVRISAQLDDASTGYHLWSASYEKEMKDILAIQREISQAITNALGVQLTAKNATDGSAIPLGDSPALDPEAYQDYLHGLAFLNKRNAESTRAAMVYFQQAIAKDPNYALAYLGLAHSYSNIPIYAAIPSHEAASQIREAASKALALDSTLGEAHIDLALACMYDYDWPSAEREFRKGLDLSPGDTFAHGWYGTYLVKIGRLTESLAEHKTAFQSDPVSADAGAGVARSHYHMHRYDEAIQQYKNARDLDPNFGIARQGLGLTYLEKGMLQEGIAETRTASQLMGGDSMITGQLGYGYAVAGQPEMAKQLLTDLMHRSSLGSVRALPVAHIYIGLGDKDRAFDWLRRAIDQKDINLYLESDPLYDTLRSDARFPELLTRMKLKP
jgi:TolB-like protein/Tfp pilus assembly protein PilF